MDSFLNQEQYKDANFTIFNKVPVMLTNVIRREKFKKKKREASKTVTIVR